MSAGVVVWPREKRSECRAWSASQPIASSTWEGWGTPAEHAEPRADAVRLSGLTLLELERGRFEDEKTIAQAKSLMRLLINHSLNGQPLATRAMVRDLQAMSPSEDREEGQ